MNIWTTGDERLLPDGVQQMNIEDGGKIGIADGGTTTAPIFEGSMNGTLYCDVLQQELTQSMEKLPNKSAYMFQQDVALWPYLKTHPRKNDKTEAERIRMISEKSGAQSSRDVVVHLG